MENTFRFTQDNLKSDSTDFRFGGSAPVRISVFPSNYSNYFTSVWADENASLNCGHVYVGSSGAGAAFSKIDIKHRVLVDSYMIDKSGQSGDFLDEEDVVDINVYGGE